jgi:hypothetical protein
MSEFRVVLYLLPLLLATVATGQQADHGALLYKDQCAKCHGDSGEGVRGEYARPLAGEDSLEKLTQYIEKWMPEDDPAACTGEDAVAVATHIYDAFYSVAAQERIRTSRIALSRMTVRQYQNAVADLIGVFRAEGDSEDEPKRGLHAEYFNSRNPGGKTAVTRVDAHIDFTFDDDEVLKSKMDLLGFAASWSGALLAPDTGRYEFTIRTDKAARFWVNDLDTPLIDAWVKSGDETEFSGRIMLLGGRAHPIRLEFTSRDQGVDMDDKKKAEDTLEGFLELEWKLPGRTAETVPTRHLVAQQVPEVFVLQTPFPPDDRSEGYERGTTVSKAWDEATTEAAIEFAGYVGDHLDELTRAEENRESADEADTQPEKAEQSGPTEDLRAFCEKLAAHAFRAPLTDEQRERYVERHFAETEDAELAVKRVVLLALKSPHFLYTAPLEATAPDYAAASSLAFSLWDSGPDQALLEAAARGELQTRRGIARQARRMIADPRTGAKLRAFLHEWLHIAQVPELAKDTDLFAEFNAHLASDLRTSLDLFLDEVVWSESSDFRQLFLSKDLYLNGPLARYYGFDLPRDAPFTRFETRQADRAGVLTHPYILSNLAYKDSTSPIHRGVLLARGILGQALNPPPEAFSPLPVDLHPTLTTRERVALQTEPEACQSCHAMINPLGFALEAFDATGRLRHMEMGKPVDDAGFFVVASGERVDFDGARELGEFLAEHRQTHRAFVVQLHHYLVKQPINAYGIETGDALVDYFAEKNYSIRALAAEIAVRAALATLPVETLLSSNQ